MRSLLLTLLFQCPFSAALFVSAQTPVYLHYGVGDGLPSNLVYIGTQDHRDLLWFGTDKGLACFDGTRFRTFGMKDGLPDPEVLNLVEDSEQRLWISSFRKNPCFRKNGKYLTIEQDSLVYKDARTAIWEYTEDTDGSVWISEQSGRIVHYQGGQASVAMFDNAVVRPVRIGNNLFMVGLRNIFRRYPDGRWKVVYAFDLPQNPKFSQYVGVSAWKNRILYSFINKLVLLEWRNGKFEQIAALPGPVGRVFVDRSGRFWVCSLSHGAYCFENNRNDLSNPVLYLPKEKVTAVFEDKQGTHWFCTINSGVFALPRNAAVILDNKNGLISNDINSLALSAGGFPVAGDDEGNLYRLDRSDSPVMASFGTLDGYNRCRQIIATPDGGVWVVTDESFCYVKGSEKKQIWINASPKAAFFRRDTLWHAASGGVGFTDTRTNESRRLVIRRFTSLCDDSEGNIWVGGIDGVFSLNDSCRYNWGQRFPPLKTRIVAMQNAGSGNMWIVTPGNGLLLVKTHKGAITEIQVVNDRLKTPVDNIQAIFQEPFGRLWLATNRGVWGIDGDGDVVHYNHQDGLADDDVNAVLVYRDTLWAATVKGLSRLVLRPPDAAGNFPTLITGARYQIDDKPVQLYLLDSLAARRNIELPPGASLFEVEFAGLDYRSRGNLRYECRTTTDLLPWQWWTLDNLIDWAGNETELNQVNTGSLSFGVRMQPGYYHMEITAITTAGLRSLEPDRLTVMMKPYWYGTIWFALLVWGVLIYAFWRFLRARVAFRKLDSAVSELQLQALQSQMNPHFIGNSINAIQQFFYPPEPALASEYIALFTRILRRTLLYSDQTFVTFGEELAYDKDYLAMVKLRFGERFRFHISGAETIAPPTPFPSMLLQPLLENATIHGLSPDGVSVLNLDFSMSGKKLVCKVTDNGIGLNASLEHAKASGKERKSKGLELLQKKVQTLNRRFDFGLQLRLRDISDANPAATGTEVAISFYPAKIPPIIRNEKN